MRKTVFWGAGLLALTLAAGFGLWATSPDPRGNPATIEATPVAPALAPLDQAITLVQRAEGDAVATLLVTGFDDETITGVDLTLLGAERTGHPLRDLASLPGPQRAAPRLDGLPRVEVAIAELLPAASTGTRHIGTGTNFPEHAAEASSSSVFQFPKFGPATPARTQVRALEGVLLDYEVELCVRFDRDIGSIADFDTAMKGVFLCGDFTNRNALVELADPDNLDSGFGFSDAKSGLDAFPSGALLVVPHDWDAFVPDLRMTTSVNAEPRQDARASEMTLDFRALAQKALSDMDAPRFAYKGKFYRLAPEPRITTDMTLMSGTSEGVIFTSPSRGDYIEGLMAYLLQGGPLGPATLIGAAKARFIENERAGGHFLQPGDRVRHASNWLGTIEVEVVGALP